MVVGAVKVGKHDIADTVDMYVIICIYWSIFQTYQSFIINVLDVCLAQNCLTIISVIILIIQILLVCDNFNHCKAECCTIYWLGTASEE